jgi:hypothetical protein
MAYEFAPDLVLVSAGFDAAVGDPEGQMLLTPSCYAQLTHLLTSFAEGKLAMFLEGGYFLPSLAESAAWTVKSLLGDAVPMPQLSSVTRPHPLICDAVHNVKTVLGPHWQCFSETNHSTNSRGSSFSEVQLPDTLPRSQKHDLVSFHSYSEPPRSYLPDNYTPYTDESTDLFSSILEESLSNHPRHRASGTAVVYDSAMKRHRNASDPSHPEKPERISSIYAELTRFGLLSKCSHVDSRLVTDRWILGSGQILEQLLFTSLRCIGGVSRGGGNMNGTVCRR